MPPSRSDRAGAAAAGRVGGLLLALTSALVIGCSWFSQDDHPVVMIENQSGTTVRVYLVADADPSQEREIIGSLGPGQQYPFDRVGCDPVFLLARDSQGREVDRSSSPTCRPSVWIIGTPEPSR